MQHIVRILEAACVTLALSMLLAGCGGSDPAAGDAASGEGATPSFTLSVDSADLEVGQGQDAALRVSIRREGGFAGPVEVRLHPGPAGIVASALVFSEALDEGFLTLSADADFAVGSKVELQVVAVGSGLTRTATQGLTVVLPQPFAQEKIAAAARTGAIDRGTALLYRAYALFGDARLPSAYVGAGSAREDNELFVEIAAANVVLPLDARNRLLPFVVRPTDVASIWNTDARSSTGTAASGRKVRLAIGPTQCPATSGPGSWMNKHSQSHPLRVWASCRGEPTHDAESAALVDRTLALLDRIYLPMTGLMGPPRPDLEGGDEAIDFYLVDDLASPTRNAGPVPKPRGGIAVADTPADTAGPGGSSFVLLNRSLPYNSLFKGVVIHEFFHVLQFAHNAAFSIRPTAADPNVSESHWFKEASAQWAEQHFDRTIQGLEGERIAWLDVHRLFKQYFLPTLAAESLNSAAGGVHAYAAYIWPYFVEQETGSGFFMGRIWADLAGVTTFEQADAVIGAAYPFATHFKRFALRNVNSELLPGDPLPLGKRHAALDRAQFLDDKVEPATLRGTLRAEQDFQLDLDLKPLSARYIRLRVDEPSIRKVTVDTSALQPGGALDVQALVLTENGWVPTPIDIGPATPVFCFDKGPATATVKGSFREILLVVSSHSPNPDARISGTLKLLPRLAPCETVWQGTIRQIARSTLGFGTEVVVTSTVDAVFEFDATASQENGRVPFRLRSGAFTHEVVSDSPARNPPCRGRSIGSGALPTTAYQPLVPAGSSAGLVVFPDTMTYTGGGLSVVTLTTTDNCNDRNQDVTSVEPAATVLWWVGTQGDLSPDGSRIRTSFTTPGNVTFDIRLDRKREGD